VLLLFPAYLNTSKAYHLEHGRYYYQLEDEEFASRMLALDTDNEVLKTLKEAIRLYRGEAGLSVSDALRVSRKNTGGRGVSDISVNYQSEQSGGCSVKKKFLILAAPFDYYQGGSEYQYKILERHLRQRYEVCYLFRHPTQPKEHHYVTYDYLFRKKYREYVFTDAWIIYRKLRQLSPDIIYKRGVNYITAIGVFYSKRHKRKSVLHIASQRDLDPSLSGATRNPIRDGSMPRSRGIRFDMQTEWCVSQMNSGSLWRGTTGVVAISSYRTFIQFRKANIGSRGPIKVIWVATSSR